MAALRGAKPAAVPEAAAAELAGLFGHLLDRLVPGPRQHLLILARAAADEIGDRRELRIGQLAEDHAPVERQRIDR